MRKKIILLFVFSTAVNALCTPAGFAATSLIARNRTLFEKNITEVAQHCIDVPYGGNGQAAPKWTVDNSHLFYLIYDEAARRSGMRYYGYAPMKQLLERTVEVTPERIRVGDLMVLQNGLAAMIYKIKEDGTYHLLYASEKRGRIVSFNSRNLVFQIYWMKNLKGFVRLTRYNFFPGR